MVRYPSHNPFPWFVFPAAPLLAVPAAEEVSGDWVDSVTHTERLASCRSGLRGGTNPQVLPSVAESP